MVTSHERNTVLFVDDEENILKSLKRGLMREKYKKLFANSGEDALRLLKSNDVSVIVTDMRMPGMSGLELLRQVKELYPDTVKIVLSGYTQLPQVLATINQVDIFKFITKPWDLENEFKKVIDDAIDFYNFKYENEILRKSVSKKNELYQKLLKSNDEKLMSVKTDFKELFSIQKDTYEFVSMLCKKRVMEDISEDDYQTSLSQVSEMFDELSHYFPSDYTEMRILEFVDEINRIVFSLYFPDVKYDPLKHARYVSFVGFEGLKEMYRGNFKLLIFVFKKIFKNVLKCQGRNIYNVIMKQGDIYSDHGKSHCKVRLLIEETMLQHETSDTIRAANVMVLDHLMRTLGGGMQVSWKNDKILIILEVDLQVIVEQTESGA